MKKFNLKKNALLAILLSSCILLSTDAFAEEELRGVITGGWGYVNAAYGISWAVILGYIASLRLRGNE